ncbi:GlsB/YeaQ/YmgE family stress response membrane protein [Pelistega suis]|uniref:GlsB/YeaQ/YmgE family stress response membrane protein n=1 Tax=Pelistega suis TaxID=1631957 RepID=UPI00211B756D|nr:GlsB/YeaQ/YmgE family stress response membrane protein [Pelistega suis]MCQ9329396.1 GlsB/YeaQ/YmgE family stress response membrane protein [Pelistega suis]
MEIIKAIVVGFIVGLIARALMPGKQSLGFIMTTVLGVAGALVGTYLGQAVGLYDGSSEAGWIGATVGAMILLFVFGLISKK